MKKLLLASTLLLGCGTEQASNLDIVGGQRAPYKRYFARVGGCGSALIHPKFLVSASHCASPSKAVIGLWKKGTNNGGNPKEEINIVEVIKHPSRDLQLLKLERRSKFRPVPLYRDGLITGDRLAVFGFGNTEFGGSAPEHLQGAAFYYTGEGAREGIIRANNRPYQAVCHGDSGSPVIFQGELVATVTFTEGRCSTKGSMGFTRLDMKWIERYVK